MARILAMKNLSLLFFAINLFPLCVYANISTEKQLFPDIFQNYDELTRPLLNHSEHVKVKIEFSLLTVHDLDMRNQELSSYVVISISWTDEFLKWNTSSYGGLNLIRVPLSKVWKPDVILTNSVNRKDIFEETGENVIIYNNGTVLWNSYNKLKTFVYVKTTYYPFEVQVFHFNFSKLHLDDTYQQNYYSSEDNVIVNFVSNGEWVFNYQRGKTTRTYTEAHNRNGKIFSNIIWQFEMDRRQTYYVWSFLVPTGALSFVSLITFLLPVKSSEKFTLAVFSLISMAVVIRLFNESLPSTSDHLSKFGIFLSQNLGLCGLVIIVNGFISCFYHRKSSKCCIPFLFCNCNFCNRYDCSRYPFTEPLVDPDQYGELVHTCKCCFSYQKKRKTYTVTDTTTTEDKMELLPKLEVNPTENSTSLDNSMLENIKSIKNRLETEVEKKTKVKKKKRMWSRVASTCDTIWMIVFLLIYVAVHTWILAELFYGKHNIA
jgi:hypothetical protein